MTEGDADMGVGGHAVDTGGEVVWLYLFQLGIVHIASEREVGAIATVSDEALQLSSNIEHLDNAVVVFDTKGAIRTLLEVGPAAVEDAFAGVDQPHVVVHTGAVFVTVQALQTLQPTTHPNTCEEKDDSKDPSPHSEFQNNDVPKQTLVFNYRNVRNVTPRNAPIPN